jgi:hypothetical protein
MQIAGSGIGKYDEHGMSVMEQVALRNIRLVMSPQLMCYLLKENTYRPDR